MFEADRRRAVAGRAMLRTLLAAHLHVSPRDVPLEATSTGKPCLPASFDSIEFNVSHSGDCILIALACAAPVGVDVERIREVGELLS
ncbi:MAG: hypothetical protein KDA71_22175, partial [Planctomycetales bacterium]|nr:hypothetical protein [Planctomycetales bacterium]